MYTVLLASFSDFFDTPGEVPFMYKKAGYKVVVFCCDTCWLRSNSFFDEWIDVNKDKETFANSLIQLIKEKGNQFDKVVLLDDETIKLMNEHITDESLFVKIMPLNKIENRGMLSSKIGMSTVFEKYNITTPRYLNFAEENNFDIIGSKLDFPVLLKVDFSFSGTGIRKCDAPNELEEKINELHDSKNVVIQEFIEGEDIGVEALFSDGELICYQAAKVLSYMNNKFSFTTRRTYFRNEKIEQSLQQLGRSVGLNSFASIGYIYHKERDAYYLIEVDPRTNSWMPYSRFTNHSFIDGLNQIAFGNNNKLTRKIKDENRETEIAIFDRDLRRCMKTKDLKGFMRWIFNYKGYWRFIPLYDRKYFSRIMNKMVVDLFKLKK